MNRTPLSHPSRPARARLSAVPPTVALLAVTLLADSGLRAGENAAREAPPGRQIRARLEQALDTWCRWLAEYVQPLPESEPYFGPPECRKQLAVPAGAFFRNVVVAIYCDPAHTPREPTSVVEGSPPNLVIQLPDIGRTVTVNLGDTPPSINVQNRTEQ